MKNLMMALALIVTLGANLIATQAYAGLEIHVVNELGQPIADAQVLIGNAVGDPFPDNIFKTDANGILQIPTQWKMALPITIEAPSYLRTTFINVQPEANTFQLHLTDSRNVIEIKGEATGFGNLKKDGKVDFGLVVPALRRSQLLQFDIGTMISSEMDTIKILTEKLTIPSNVTLPEQKESYILPVTFNKPGYRMYVKQPGDYRMVAAHGQFPLKQVVDQMQKGKTFFDVLNYFTFIGAGQRDIQVSANVTGQDIAVNQVPFTSKVSVTGPALAGTDVMVSISMTEQNGLLFASDIKSIKSGQALELRSSAPAGDGIFVASLMLPLSEVQMAMPENQDVAKQLTDSLKRLIDPPTSAPSQGGLSLSLQPATATSLVPEFMSLVPRPQIQGSNLVFGKPVASPNIAPVATYVVLAEIEKAPAGSNGAEKRFRLWEVYSQGWVDNVALPELVNEMQPGKTYRWEVLFLGADATKTRPLNRYFLDDVTYLSRNSIDF